LAGEPDAGEVAARWRGPDTLSQDEIARYAYWHRERLHAVFTAAQIEASPADLERVVDEGALRALEFEHHLKWIRKQRMK
jgi:predicted outer membrane protein